MKTKAWKLNAIVARRWRKRLARVKSRARAKPEQVSARERIDAIAPLVNVESLNSAYRAIEPPEVLDLDQNYTDTIAFFALIRRASDAFKGHFMVDFKKIQEISPAAALLLVAECDRWKEKTGGRRLAVVDLDEWNPSVRRRLMEMGFFELLKVREVPRDTPDGGDDQFIKFLSGARNTGNSAKELRESIEALGPKISYSKLLYDGLVEAMTNTDQHAYAKGSAGSRRAPEKRSAISKWWISASVNTSNNTMTVMALDHGQGIARSLPRKANWFAYKSLLGEYINDDTKRLEVAFDDEAKPSSSTGLDYRGKGLRENIKGYLSSHDCTGHLTVISNKAKYQYFQNRKNGTLNGKSHVKSSAIRPGFEGTFIQWVIKDYSYEPSTVN